jgi:prefoldin alpha subunit
VTSVETVDPREVQQLQAYLNEYGQQMEYLSRQLAIIDEGRREAAAAIDTLQVISSAPSSAVVLPVGGGTGVRVHVENPDSVMVSIGSEVTVEKSNEEAVEYLRERIVEMDASGKKVAESIEKVRSQINEISYRLEYLYEQARMTEQVAQ